MVLGLVQGDRDRRPADRGRRGSRDRRDPPFPAPLVDRRRFTLTADSRILADLAKAAWHAEVPLPPFFYMTEPARPAKEAGAKMAPATVTLARPSRTCGSQVLSREVRSSHR